MKRNNKGWSGERMRHSMSKRGISTRGIVSEMYYQELKAKPRRHMPLDEEYKKMVQKEFESGGKGFNKPFFDDDWFRYYPDGTWENHELCTGCKPDGTCDFHPLGCDCSQGACQVMYEDEEEIESISYPKPELIPPELQEELLEEFQRGLDVGMTRDQAISSAVEYVVYKIENINNDGEEEREVDTETFHAMELMLTQEPNIPIASGKKYKPHPIKYTMPLGPLQHPLNLQHGTKVKMDLDGVQIFSGTVSMTESDERWLRKVGYNPDDIVMVTFWRGRIKNTDFFPKNRIVAIKQSDDTKYVTVREWQKDRPNYQKVSVVN